MYRMMLLLLLSMAGSAQAGLHPDTTFGGAGLVDVDVGGTRYDSPPELVVLPDRRILAAVLPLDVQPRPPQLKVVRLLPDGSRDASFGANGIATVALSAQPADYGNVVELRRLADGRLLVLVSTTWIEYPDYHPELRLLRLNPDGSPDPSFNAGQPLLLSIPGWLKVRLLIQADGLLLVGLDSDCCVTESGFHALRLRADGSPDPAFGNAGELVVAPAESVSSDAMSVPGGGFQILHTRRPTVGNPLRSFWRRYRSDGSLDTAFGVGGQQDLVVTENDPSERLQELPDGTWLGFVAYCPLRLFDAEGRVLRYLPGCTDFDRTIRPSTDFTVQFYGDRWLMSGEQRSGFPEAPPADGTYLFATDHGGRIDRGFADTPSGNWRSADKPGASYTVAADGDAHVVLARSNLDSGIRVLRYRELRGGSPSALPVPVLTPAGLMLLLAALSAAAALTLRRRRMQ